MRSTNRILAGILAIVLGSFGLHKFYMGYMTEGVVMLAVTLLFGGFHIVGGLSIMGLIGVMEGVIYLTRSDSEFYGTYVMGRKGWL